MTPLLNPCPTDNPKHPSFPVGHITDGRNVTSVRPVRAPRAAHATNPRTAISPTNRRSESRCRGNAKYKNNDEAREIQYFSVFSHFKVILVRDQHLSKCKFTMTHLGLKLRWWCNADNPPPSIDPCHISTPFFCEVRFAQEADRIDLPSRLLQSFALVLLESRNFNSFVHVACLKH